MNATAIDNATPGGDLADLLDWLRRFEKDHGRALRVLHVGNIANNGYLNVKFLRSFGVDADVVSRDYYHVMAVPEWEELEINLDYGDDNYPVFNHADLAGYVRPRWFISGSLSECVRAMGVDSPGPKTGEVSQHWSVPFRTKVSAFAVSRIGGKVGTAIKYLFDDPRLFVEIVSEKLAIRTSRKNSPSPEALFATSAFDRAFPERLDRLTESEVEFYCSLTPYFRKMFEKYDIVQCYATEPIHAYLAGNKPYVAFEHGTLRDFTLADNSLSRLNALAYNQAKHCFITNGDCLEYANRIGISRFSPIPHPIDLKQHRYDTSERTKKIRRELDAEVVLFCPVRHDFAIKGTDIHLHALPIIKALTKKSVRLVLIGWGKQVDESRRILEKYGCGDDVVWKRPMSRPTMINYIRASDVVLDQMALPHFGSTAPQCLAAGVPVISSYVATSTDWMFAEPAPILPAFTAEDVARAVLTALDKEWLCSYQEAARLWMDKFHSPERIVLEHLKVYQKVLTNDA